MVEQKNYNISFPDFKETVNNVYWKHLYFNEKRLQIVFGGSSSGKSHELAKKCVLRTLRGRNYLVLRKVGSTIQGSVYNEIVEKIHDLKLQNFFKINKTNKNIYCTLTGGEIMFCGCDNVQKLKSVKPRKGVITDLWLEEATEFSKKDYKQLRKRLRGKTQFKKQITLSFNPIFKLHWIYKSFFTGKEGFELKDIKDYKKWKKKRFYANDNEKLSILKVIYKDNRFLETDDIEELEDEDDKYFYNVYSLGNWGVLGNQVFKNWIVKSFNKEAFDRYKYGLDWGWKDKFAFLRVAISHKHKRIYICDEIYQSELSNEASSKLIKPIFKNHKRALIVCDSSEPKSIDEYNDKYGINAIGAIKGAGSIENGIKFLQEFQIIIHPSCIHFFNEILLYKHKETKDGDVLDEVVDKFNHLMDALRYAIENEIVKERGLYYKRMMRRRNAKKLA